MSADNGIYILKTKDQYRIIHAQAIENLWWSYIHKESQDDIIPTRILEYYNDSPIFTDEAKVQKVAFSMLNNFPYVEYGIQTIRVNRTWDEIVNEAKELAPKEIEAIKNNNDGRWEYSLRRLEKILTCI